ncbi:hypothetical protein G9A89_003429 [Geosiphon pyriformis]|nr:hypothetical protein G9A89_003429 [Geosiphon pyriformis]
MSLLPMRLLGRKRDDENSRDRNRDHDRDHDRDRDRDHDHDRDRDRDRDHDKRHNIVFTAAESWLSSSLARGLLNERRFSNWNIRAVTRDLRNLHARELERFGAEVADINYNDQDSLRELLRGTYGLVYIPENHRNRVQMAETLSKAAKDANVKGVIMISVENADQDQTSTHRDYAEIERIWHDSLECVVIFSHHPDSHHYQILIRLPLVQQALWLWSDSAIDQGKIRLQLQERDQFASVNLEDVVRSIRCLLLNANGKLEGLEKNHHHKTYTLTGPNAISPRDIVETINRNIRRREKRVHFEEVDRREVEDYLRNLRENVDDNRDEDDRRRSSELLNGAYRYQRGLSLIHEAIADLLKGGKNSVKQGAITFHDAVQQIESAIYLISNNELEENRIQKYESRRERINRRIRQRVNERVDIRSALAPLEELKTFSVDLICNSNPEERGIIVEELCEAFYQFENSLPLNSVLPNQNRDRDGRNRDGRNVKGDIFPYPFLPLQVTEIDIICDLLDTYKNGLGSEPTGDVEKITSRNPEPIESFIKENIHDFTPDERNNRPRHPTPRPRPPHDPDSPDRPDRPGHPENPDRPDNGRGRRGRRGRGGRNDDDDDDDDCGDDDRYRRSSNLPIGRSRISRL